MNRRSNGLTALLISIAVLYAIVVRTDSCFAQSDRVDGRTRLAQSDLADQPKPLAQIEIADGSMRLAQSDLAGGPKRLAQSDLADRPKRPLLVAVTMENLSQDNRQLADDLELSPMLSELYDTQHLPNAERMKELRVKIRETIIECYLDASSVQAEARREQNNRYAILAALQSKVNRAINYNNAVNFITSGTLNMVGSSINFSPSVSPVPGSLTGLLSGAVSTVLSTYTLKQNSGGKISGQDQSNVLAELFGRPCNSKTAYPESVWRFLHERSPRAPTMTRAQLLEKEWIEKGYLQKHGSRRAQLKIDFVCGLPIEKKCMTIGDLNDEINMIGDIEALTGLMDHRLRDILAMIDTDVLEARIK